MKQFNLEEYLANPSRKVVTRDGRNVRIVCTDSPDAEYRITGFVDDSVGAFMWKSNGEYSSLGENDNDLFFADEEEELTVFEKELEMMMVSFSNRNFNIKEMPKQKLHNYAHRLLDLARKELKEDWKTPLRFYKNGYKQGKHACSKPFVCVETGKIYYCQRELAEELGEDMKGVSHITRACKYGLLDHGFHWRYYEPNELVKLLFEKGYTKYPISYDGDEWFCYCQMALKWLREVHNLHITIKPYITEEGIMYLFEIYKLEAEKFTLIKTKTGFEKSEQANEAALKYTLENLI